MTHKIYYEEPFNDFMDHPPYDYSRPHKWCQYPNYISIGEFIYAVLKWEETKNVDFYNIMEQWHQQYLDYFPKMPTRSQK